MHFVVLEPSLLADSAEFWVFGAYKCRLKEWYRYQQLQTRILAQRTKTAQVAIRPRVAALTCHSVAYVGGVLLPLPLWSCLPCLTLAEPDMIAFTV